jgi:hypothetical protein
MSDTTSHHSFVARVRDILCKCDPDAPRLMNKFETIMDQDYATLGGADICTLTKTLRAGHAFLLLLHVAVHTRNANVYSLSIPDVRTHKHECVGIVRAVQQSDRSR